jgi:SAM-dependent methyltransferase
MKRDDLPMASAPSPAPPAPAAPPARPASLRSTASALSPAAPQDDGRNGAAPSTPEAAWRAIHAAASAPHRRAGRFAWHFARGKLGRDPVFRALLQRGELPPRSRVVDIGCGQGLLASLLQACGDLDQAGRWPAAWPPAPYALGYRGIELMLRDVERARLAHAAAALAPVFECSDMRRAVLPPCDLVVILDVLHYVDHAAQSALLVRVRDALLQGRAERAERVIGASGASAAPGRLLLRVGDASSKRGFAASQWVDRVVTLVRGHRAPPTWGRPLADWVALLRELGFDVRSVPMSQGTPFANVLLVADVVGRA